MKNYGVFARVYDALMDESLFLKWRDYTSKHIPNTAANLLELGCGNGELGILLKKMGYDIVGLDLSEEMLAIAQEKQKEAEVDFPLIHGDMRYLSTLGMYEGIISFCDTLCYLPSPEDLTLVFNEVFAHLKKEGIFLFDVFTTEYIEKLDGYSHHDEIPGLVFIWDSYQGLHEHSIEHELSFFEELADGNYRRHIEIHEERTYPLDFYLSELKKAGFSKVEVTADFDQEVGDNNTRWFFKAQK